MASQSYDVATQEIIAEMQYLLGVSDDSDVDGSLEEPAASSD